MPPPQIVTLDQYLSLISSEHQNKPKYMATVALSVQPLLDILNTALSLIGIYDLDTAVGEQLDFTGQWIGIGRTITTPLDVWFTWGKPGLGWGEGKWQVPFEAFSEQTQLDDPNYRILLYSRVLANFWDGTIPGAYAAWEVLFGGTGYQIVLQDGQPRPEGNTHGNMHIIQALLGPPLDAVTSALFSGGYLGLKSAGVGVKYMTQSQPASGFDGTALPLFGWGAPGETSTLWDGGATVWDNGATTWDPRPATYPPTILAGWGSGAWGQIVSPTTSLTARGKDGS